MFICQYIIGASESHKLTKVDIIRLFDGAIVAHPLFNPLQIPNFNLYKAGPPAHIDHHLVGLFHGHTFFANRLSLLNARNSKV